MRLDVLLFQKKMFPSREKAKDAIMRGIVKVNGVTIWKAGYVVEEDVEISLTGEPIKYVSRAGLKLEKAKEYGKNRVSYYEIKRGIYNYA